MDTKVVTDTLSKKILTAARTNDQAIQQLSVALLSRNEAKIRQTFQDAAGITLTEEEMRIVQKNWGTEKQIEAQIAACT